MQTTRLIVYLCTVICFTLVNTSVLADTRLVYQDTEPGQATTTRTVEISPPFVRFGESDDDSYTLFDTKRRVMTSVDMSNRTYTPITKSDARRMGNAMQTMTQKMQESMKEMPAQMRQAYQQMLEQMRAQRQPANFEYQLNMGSARVGDYSCSQMQILRNGKAWKNMCVADISELDISADDYAVLNAMRQMMIDMYGQAATSMPDLKKIKGIPLKTVDLDDGETDLLTGVSHAGISAHRFQVPKGYTLRTLPRSGSEADKGGEQ